MQRHQLLREIGRHRSVYGLLLLPLVYFVIFRYVPIWNAQIAFRDFAPLIDIPEDPFMAELLGIDPDANSTRGVFNSVWVGLYHFRHFINSFFFWEIMRNTLGYSFGKLLFGLPVAILLAVMIFECTKPGLAKAVQTLAYLPHFLSWVIMFGILQTILSPDDGILNDAIRAFGGEPVAFLTNVRAFPWIVILSDAWHTMGWSAIIFIAALIGIDPTLFEAATVEGVSARQRVWYITLPSIRPVIIMVVLLRLGTILDAGFLQIFMLYSPAVFSVADIVDTWVYRQGLLHQQFSLATSVGLFKGVVGLALILTANWLTKKFGDSSMF